MQRIAFKMYLKPGNKQEYKIRHDQIWPELVTLLKSVGICNYGIFLDDETNILFANLEIEDPSLLDTLPKHDIMQKWWASMAPLMETNADKSPKSKNLEEVFFMN